MNARRATNRTPNPRVRVIALLALSFLLALLDGRGSTGFLNTIRSGASAVLSPLQSGANAMSRPAVDFLRDWSEVGSKDDRIKELNSVNAKLRQQLLTVQDLDRQAKELHHLFQMAGTAGYNIVPARVMSLGSSSGFGSTALLDIGSDDGVKKNQTVMAGEGMVGRVIAVTARTSTVLLLIDPTSTIGARITGSGEIGFLSGTGSPNDMKLQFINPEASVKAGDLLVSYGVSGGVFTPGLPLGKVTYVETAQGTASAVATVEPFVRISALDVVGVVVTKPRNDPRDSLIPQVTAAPTVTVTVTPQPTMSATVSASATKSGA